MAPNEEYIIRHLQIVQTRITRLKQSPGMEREKEVAFSEFDPKEFGGDIRFDKSLLPTQSAPAQSASSLDDDNRKELEKDTPAKSSKKPVTPTATTTTSVSSSKKVSPPPSSMGVMAHQVPSSQIEEPVFIESDAMTSHVHNDYHYRPSNSGHDTMSRNINANFHYNRKVIKGLSQNYHHHNHHHTTRGQRRDNHGATTVQSTPRGSKPRPIGTDFDDPSSGMS